MVHKLNWVKHFICLDPIKSVHILAIRYRYKYLSVGLALLFDSGRRHSVIQTWETEWIHSVSAFLCAILNTHCYFVCASLTQQRMHLNVCDIRNHSKRLHIQSVCYFRSIVCTLMLLYGALWLSSAPTRFINVCAWNRF